MVVSAKDWARAVGARFLIGASLVAGQLVAFPRCSAAEESLPTPPQASGWQSAGTKAKTSKPNAPASGGSTTRGPMSSMEFATPPQPSASATATRGGMSSIEYDAPPAVSGAVPRVASPNAPTTGGATAMRSGGILNESFDYHHPQPMRSAIERGRIPQATGWYNYGFPMQSYRWGYFGAERHYPRVSWHEGYYGDKVWTAYRYAY